jgi:ubiquinone/menaquinone biosynthesis C-methylase UbiE
MSTFSNNKKTPLLEQWVVDILANPITKKPAAIQEFKSVNGVVDARVLLKNTIGYSEWMAGQFFYEECAANAQRYKSRLESYKAEINYDRPIYEHFTLRGVVLDVGGGIGTVREFLDNNVKFVSVDPFASCMQEINHPRIEAYSCLSMPLNFICAVGEFLPFIDSQFDWVHMRSTLDHVQVPDLVLLEAQRVLKDDGNLLVGLYVEGGKSGNISCKHKITQLIKNGLPFLGISKWKDHHTWHPTFSDLTKLIEDNGFVVSDVYWQPHWKEHVCYVLARKKGDLKLHPPGRLLPGLVTGAKGC